MTHPNYLCIFTIVFSLFTCKVISQNCQVCTYTIINDDTSTYVIDSGKTLCIATSGIFAGKLILNGGVVCNTGAFQPSAFTYTSGDFENYGRYYFRSAIVLRNRARFINHKDGKIQGKVQASGDAIFIPETQEE